jgi:hypothetical protein
MPKYFVRVAWTMVGYTEVDATDDMDMAKQIDEMGLDRFDGSYLEDSFVIEDYESGDATYYGPPMAGDPDLLHKPLDKSV